MPDDLASVFRLQPYLILTKHKCVEERNWSLYAFEHYYPQDVDKYIHIFGPDFTLNHVKLCSSSIIEEDEG